MTKCVTGVTGGDYLFGGVTLGVRLFVLIRVCKMALSSPPLHELLACWLALRAPPPPPRHMYDAL